VEFTFPSGDGFGYLRQLWHLWAGFVKNPGNFFASRPSREQLQ
jgi:hypothetical protein